MFKGLKSSLGAIGDAVKSGVDLAGSPIGALLNPAALKEISDNIVEAAPPSTVLVGVLSRIVSEAIAIEMLKRGPSDSFYVATAALHLDQDDADRLFNLVWEEFVNA